jgi:hypothetical protein
MAGQPHLHVAIAAVQAALTNDALALEARP